SFFFLSNYKPLSRRSSTTNSPTPANSTRPVEQMDAGCSFSNLLITAQILQLYDLDKDKICHHELLQMNITDEQLNSIADQTVQEADQDGKVGIKQKIGIQFFYYDKKVNLPLKYKQPC
uniref:Uncharacterized protein n=1 Tax=Erpetoichthys calabaricus TaxID=27687 RepID=A0A8C4T6R4_ERPCA